MPASEAASIHELLDQLDRLTVEIRQWIENPEKATVQRVQVLYKQREEILRLLQHQIFRSEVQWSPEQIKVWRQKVDSVHELDREIVERLEQKVEVLRARLLQKQQQRKVLQYQIKGNNDG